MWPQATGRDRASQRPRLSDQDAVAAVEQEIRDSETDSGLPLGRDPILLGKFVQASNFTPSCHIWMWGEDELDLAVACWSLPRQLTVPLLADSTGNLVSADIICCSADLLMHRVIDPMP